MWLQHKVIVQLLMLQPHSTQNIRVFLSISGIKRFFLKLQSHMAPW